MMKYGEKFEKIFRKGAKILAFSKRNFFFDHPLSVTLTSSYDSYADVDTRDGNLSIASFFQVGFCKIHESLCSPCALLEYLCLKQFDSRRA